MKKSSPLLNHLIRYALILLGIVSLTLSGVIPAALFFGSAILMSLILLEQRDLKIFLWMVPFFVVSLTPWATRLFVRTDWALFIRSVSILFTQRPEEIFYFINDYFIASVRALRPIYSLGVLCILTSYFYHQRDRLRPFKQGLLFGGFLAVGAVLLKNIFEARFVGEASSFWLAQGREGGFVSDPNALGVVSYLMCGIAFHEFRLQKRLPYLILMLGWLGLGLASGSRVFILGLLVAVIVLLLLPNSRYRPAPRKILTGIFFLLGAITLSYRLGLALPLPLSLNRLIESFDQGVLHTRIPFWHTSIALWSHAPLTGFGLGQFSHLFTEAAIRLGYNLNGWTDNPNNFFLWLLVETGALGLASFLFISLQWKLSSHQPVLFAFFIGFVVQLLFGPHLQFLEVSLCLAFILPEVIVEREDRVNVSSKWLVLGGISLVLFTGFISVRETMGVVFSEHDTVGWVMRDAQVEIVCHNDQFTITYYSPFKGRSPLEVAIQVREKQDSLLFSESDTITRTYPCEKNRWGLSERVPLKISCSRFWLPSLLHLQGDRRPKCVQMRVEGGVYG